MSERAVILFLKILNYGNILFVYEALPFICSTFVKGKKEIITQI